MGGFGSGASENPALRLFRKIHKDKSGCWILKSYGKHHYPAFNFAGRTMGAHRASYLLFVGKIPPKKVVMHICDNYRCVNPDHLVVGSHRENTQDMVAKGRGWWLQIKRGKCLFGHDITKKSNISMKSSGRWTCIICRRLYDKRRRSAQKESKTKSFCDTF